MWAALFFVVLILVHIQFKYCAQIAIGALKLFETAIIVLVLRAYMESDVVWEYIGNLAENLPEIPWDTWDTTWDTLQQLLYKYQATAQE